MDEQQVWDAVGVALQRHITTQDWCSWFVGARCVELSATAITLELANEFAVSWVTRRFHEPLQAAVLAALGAPLHVTLRAADPAAGTASAPQPRVAEAAAGPSDAMSEHELRAALADNRDDRGQTLDQRPAVSFPAAAAPHTRANGDTPHPAHGQVHDPADAQLAGVMQLNPKYRFDTFVIGPGNQMVHAAALSVAEAPAQSYNPLFVHGSTGLGKTHLLHAIGNYILDTRPHARVAYITIEQFLQRFQHVIAQRKTGDRDLRDRFKSYFRGVDVLLMDDVQFLAGRGAWVQEELFHLFNALHESGRQIVLTSDCQPERIPQLEERLRSRFAWGLIADIDTPDQETRVAIVRKKAHDDRMGDIPQDVLELIARHVTSNVRELEGALTRVIAEASLSARPVTYELAAQVLDSYAPQHAEPVTITRIQDVICRHFSLEREDLLSARRSADVTLPRQIGMYLSRTLAGAASTQVAHQFNRKDHSTVLHAARQVDSRMQHDREFHDLVAQLTAQLRATPSGAAR